MTGTPLSDAWLDLAWTGVVLANLALVAVALRRVAETDHHIRLTRVGLGVLAVLAPFVGPGVAMLMLPPALDHPRGHH